MQFRVAGGPVTGASYNLASNESVRQTPMVRLTTGMVQKTRQLTLNEVMGMQQNAIDPNHFISGDSTGLFFAKKHTESGYNTLTSTEIPQPHKHEIWLGFSDNTDSRQINLVIASNGGEIVEDPNDKGVYLVRIKQASSSNSVLDTVLSLRKEPHVIYAKPEFTQTK